MGMHFLHWQKQKLTMKVIILLALVHMSLGGLYKLHEREDPVEITNFETSSEEMDNDDELGEEEFEAQFGEEPVDDPEEMARRAETLKEEEDVVKERDIEYLDGEIEWYEKIGPYSDLPEDEFEAERTGSKEPSYARGLINPEPGMEPVDEKSERYFDTFRYSRGSAPASYSSVDLGYTTQVKNQKQCGSCVAFSNMAAIEVCFKKLTGSEGDYSEQQLVDCGYGKNGASGCNGAWTYSYLQTVADSGLGLGHESNYPYKSALGTCSAVEEYKQGAKVSSAYYTYNGDEDLLAKLVAEHGAAVTSVRAAGEMMNYAGGVFAGCTSSDTDHAVAVVGYGTSDKGEDYWLIKNSWGSDWGEGGYIRLKRGVGMCGVGKAIATVSCEKVDGPTSAPLTTATPCVDKYSNCPDLAKTNCKAYGEHCQKSCGLCAGMTPHSSNTCADTWNNCNDLAKNSCYRYGSKCCISCGLGDGMTPAKSNTCYDKYSNCASLCKWYPDDCKASCGKC